MRDPSREIADRLQRSHPRGVKSEPSDALGNGLANLRRIFADAGREDEAIDAPIAAASIPADTAMR